MATHSGILAWRTPWTEEPGGYSPWGCKESDTTEVDLAHTPVQETQEMQVQSLGQEDLLEEENGNPLQYQFSSVQSLSRLRLFATP